MTVDQAALQHALAAWAKELEYIARSAYMGQRSTQKATLARIVGEIGLVADLLDTSRHDTDT